MADLRTSAADRSEITLRRRAGGRTPAQRAGARALERQAAGHPPTVRRAGRSPTSRWNGHCCLKTRESCYRRGATAELTRRLVRLGQRRMGDDRAGVAPGFRESTYWSRMSSGVSVDVSILRIAPRMTSAFWRLKFFGKSFSPLEIASARPWSWGITGLARVP